MTTNIQIKSQNTAINSGVAKSAKIVAYLGINAKEGANVKILDYGCGTGRNIKFMKDAIDREKIIIGYDTKEQKERSTKNWKKIVDSKTKFTDNEKYMIEGAYDLILNSHVLNVVEDEEVRKHIVENIYTLLNYYGRAVFEVRTDVEKNAHKWKSHKDGYLTSSNTFQKQFTKEELKELLESVGFEILSHDYTSSHHIVTCRK